MFLSLVDIFPQCTVCTMDVVELLVYKRDYNMCTRQWCKARLVEFAVILLKLIERFHGSLIKLVLPILLLPVFMFKLYIMLVQYAFYRSTSYMINYSVLAHETNSVQKS